MAWYTLSYDLRRELSSEDYTALFEALTSASDWCRPLLSFWVLETSLAPSTIIERLLNVGVLDDNDGIIVLEITGKGDFRRVIDENAAAWLRTHITRL